MKHNILFALTLSAATAVIASPPSYTTIDLGVQDAGEGLIWAGATGTPTSFAVGNETPNFSATIYAYNSAIATEVGTNTVAPAGIHAFRWVLQPGTGTWIPTDLGELPPDSHDNGPQNSAALGLNAVGDIVGYSDSGITHCCNTLQTASHATLWRNGTLTDLGAIAGPEFSSAAYAVNDSHEIVGQTQTIGPPINAVPYSNVLERAFIDIGGVMYNLTFYVQPRVLLESALSIDCQGNTAAVGTPLAGGATHAYLLIRREAPRVCPAT